MSIEEAARPATADRERLAPTLEALATALVRDEQDTVAMPYEPLAALLVEAAALLPGRVSLSLARAGRRGRLESLATSDARAGELDVLQARLCQGPVVEVLDTQRELWSPSLTADGRWPHLARALDPSTTLTVASRPLLTHDGRPAALTAYGLEPSTVGPGVPATGLLALDEVGGGGQDDLAGLPVETTQALRLVAAVVHLGQVASAVRRERDNLRGALESNRRIGAAVGVVMALGPHTYDEAVAVLLRASQNSNRKMRDVAEDLLSTGEIPPAAREGEAGADPSGAAGPVAEE